ncbi:hypothetical protein [Roseisolibacter agri]|uniref:Uncharacterized protein n=1 Tax=Roseisolibacter agri TaxID=2014610 RepID=A0AA37QGP3_9BACT|nr:hypothetical protein [Roseisolibacter agri]GLC25463.1 hypothetical protein rosag_19760 [Roseisolibacter agri]
MTNRILPPGHGSGHGPADHDDDAPEVAALDRLIAEAARDYHRPPAQVPRDAMWEAIMAARGTRAGAAPIAPVAPVVATPVAETPVVSLDAARAARRARAPRFTRSDWSSGWSMAAAAALLLAVGVAGGRWWEGRAQVGAPAPAVAVTGSTPDSATPDARRADSMTAAPSMVAEAPTAEPAPSSTPSSTPSLEPADRTPTREVASRTVRTPARAGARRLDTDRLAYDVATVRHLTSVEALLVSYRADPLDSLADARVAQWARTLLQDTRLLLDSPAASSPVRRRLFEDLELVLVQMARLAPADSTSSPARLRREREERALIDGTMRDARVLPRLRREIPAGVGT